MITLISGTSRENSNTELLGDRLLNGLSYKKIDLRKYNIAEINDKRHSEEGFKKIEDDYYDLIDTLLNSDTLIFATPLYWYGMSGYMKNFIDRFSESLRDDVIDFKNVMKGKKAYVVIVGGDNPKVKALPLINQFKYIFDFLGIEFIDYIIGEGNKPKEVINDLFALAKADMINSNLKDN